MSQSKQEDQVDCSVDCRKCGACCATVRDWMIITEFEKEGKKNLSKLVMTADGEPSAYPNGRCRALTGTVGGSVMCAAYPNRPMACVIMLQGTPACRAARAKYGLVHVRKEYTESQVSTEKPVAATRQRKRIPLPWEVKGTEKIEEAVEEPEIEEVQKTAPVSDSTFLLDLMHSGDVE